MQKIRSKRKLALVIPAHNERLAIEPTILSAIKAGQPQRDIYVVDDGSRDRTREIARNVLGEDQVLRVRRCGKMRAVKQAIDHFSLVERYRWVHIADADGLFDRRYFRIFRPRLNWRKYVGATGYVKSLPGDWVCKYRVFEYTWGLEVTRRLQFLLGVITVMPGPTSCFRSDIIGKLDFESDSLTEDFELTLQIHRRKLGPIQYIPQAKTNTQDPQNFQDFYRQINRWYQGIFRGIRKHRVGFKPQKIDAYLGYSVFQTFLYAYTMLIFIPAVALINRAPELMALAFLNDFIIFLNLTLITAAISKRWDILSAFPLFYIARWTYIWVFLKAFTAVIIFNKFRNLPPGWSTKGRRYQLAKVA